ncbi:cytokinin riboside 5'-monophosphate phosphoribohydrolase [Bryobacterales bacterium F-183]|nr:cytokinin riboside 5'-monophosphate phosphoribohydrolase [Bryobacterales bacterium F-183]
MSALSRICLFCGSSSGLDPAYSRAIIDLTETMAARHIGLVYGGAHVGLMGLAADTILAAGGRAYGVIPQSMVDREIAHKGLTELHIVTTMHQRKALMADLASAFIAAPGAYGTLDELCEILTWAQLEIHSKPIGLLNTNGYWDPLLVMLDRAVEAGFLKAKNRALVLVDSEPASLIDKLAERSNFYNTPGYLA